jgi:CPA2 family monovalent cation:H+ antiporter-2
LLFLDVAVIAAIVIAASLSSGALTRWAENMFHFTPRVVRIAMVVATLVLLAPFVLGAIRIARALGVALAAEALPSPEGGAGLDLAAAPRRALLVTLQMAILLVAGIPVVAVTQPFIPGVEGMAILLVALVLLVFPLWRSATNLQGHVRAGAQVLLEALATQSASEGTTGAGGHGTGGSGAGGAGPELLPGLGNARAIRLPPASRAIGQTLRALNLRGLTGATVIAIDREPADVVYPTADETLREADTLILTGTAEAVDAARGLLAEGMGGAEGQAG